jgi:cell division GTPase FtsZ
VAIVTENVTSYVDLIRGTIFHPNLEVNVTVLNATLRELSLHKVDVASMQFTYCM